MKYINLISKFSFIFLLTLGCSQDDILDNQNLNKSNNINASAKNANMRVVIIAPNPDPNELTDINFEIQENTTIELIPGAKYQMAPIFIGDCNASTRFSNFRFNGNGAIINFPHNGVGIEVCNTSNIRLEKFMITNRASIDSSKPDTYGGDFSGRIKVYNCDTTVIDSISIEKQGETNGDGHLRRYQIVIEESTYCQVSNSKLFDASGELIGLIASKNCIISDNITYGGASGISTEGKKDSNGNDLVGRNNYIVRNMVYDAEAAYITVNDQETVVKDNTIKTTDPNNSVGGPGIRFGHYAKTDSTGAIILYYTYLRAINCKAINNRIHNFKGANTSSKIGIRVDATDKNGVTIEGNTITNCSYGVQVSNQPHQWASIKNNKIDAIDRAIFLLNMEKSKKTTITGNIISSKKIGIRLQNASAIISNNIKIEADSKAIQILNASTCDINTNSEITSKDIGIHVIDTDIPTIFKENNIISKNQSIALFNVKNATISNKNNLVSDNTVIQLFNSIASITNNTIKSTSIEHNPLIAGIVIQNTEANRSYNSRSDNISITKNDIQLSGAYGIFNNEDTRLKNTLIDRNTITNGHIGIYFGGENTTISANSITNNSLVNDQYSKPIYLRYGTKGCQITKNKIKNDITSAVYLESTINTDISSNIFEFTGTGKLGYGVWQSGFNSGLKGDETNNTLTKYINFTNK